jgi:anti-sigma factor RsiW
MTSCRGVQKNLTAWVDGELSPHWTERVRAHVAKCPRCAAEADSLRTSIVLQSTVLTRLSEASDVDTAALGARLRRAVATEAEAHWPAWSWIFRPVVLAPALALLAVLLLFTAAGGPTDVLVPLGVVPPPPAVKRAPGLFKDYTLIQHLDALQHFDTVESEPLDDEQGAQTG